MAKHLFRVPLNKIMTRFSGVFNSPVTLKNSDRVATFEVPGLAYKDFGRTGIPAIWELLRVIETDRILTARYPQFLVRYEGYPGCVCVLSAQTIHLTPNFYEKASIHLPMIYTVSPGRLGKKTATAKTTLSEKSTGVVLIESERQFAFLDEQTGRAGEIPQEMQQLFREHGMKNMPAFKIPIPNKPLDFYKYTCEVRHSDSDMLYHANQSVFVKYCMDCAASAQDDGQLKVFLHDILAIPVNTVAILYKSEAFINDKLGVHMWPDQEDPHTLHFQVYKDDKEIVNCSISFYKQDLHSQL